LHAELHQDYEKTIRLAPAVGTDWPGEVIFHTIWDCLDRLNEKHIICLKSAYVTNVLREGEVRLNRTIYLWTFEDWKETKIVKEARRYATIKKFDFDEMLKHSPLPIDDPSVKEQISWDPCYVADLARFALLWRYGGMWFDIDVLFLRDFDPLFATFHDQVFAYAWGTEDYPNNAILFAPEPKHVDIFSLITVLVAMQEGFGFQNTLRFSSPVPMTVLPCSWFDASWIDNPLGLTYHDFFSPSVVKFDCDNFFPGAFAYHWHNQYSKRVATTSPAWQVLAALEVKFTSRELKDVAKQHPYAFALSAKEEQDTLGVTAVIIDAGGAENL